MKKERKTKPGKSLFARWLDGEIEVMDLILDDTTQVRDPSREALKLKDTEFKERLDASPRSKEAADATRRRFYLAYTAVAVISCIFLIGVLLFAVSDLPRFGEENVMADAVVKRYVEKGLEETGAVNVVSGMILDYRAFDTLGESHVLFTALICVMILLRIDKKNMAAGYEDYYTVLSDRYYSLAGDNIIRYSGTVIIPIIFIYGIYILVNGQNSPGGGFSGGAVMGAGMIIFAAAFGFERTDRFFTARVSAYTTFVSLMFYSFAKGFVFFTGANGLGNPIPRGTPGAIFSGGLILPLDIAVGLVVACTMFGFYSLFRRGSIGGD